MPDQKPEQDSWPTVIALAIVPTIVAVLFGGQLDQHHLSVGWIAFGAATAFLGLYDSLDHFRQAWKRTARPEQDQT